MITTPFGGIRLTLDGIPVPYSAAAVADARLFPDVDGAYLLRFDFENDGAFHTLDCVLDDPSVNSGPDSGEGLEAVSIYADQGKLTIGSKSWLYGPGCDHDGVYLPNGLRLLLTPRTKSKALFFGVSWMDHCGDDDVQTWLAADPAITERTV